MRKMQIQKTRALTTCESSPIISSRKKDMEIYRHLEKDSGNMRKHKKECTTTWAKNRSYLSKQQQKCTYTKTWNPTLRFILKKHTHTCPRRFYKNIYSDSSSTSNKQNSVPINSSPRKIQTIKSELYIYIKANTYASHKKINQDLPFNVLVEDFMAEFSQLWKT